ncbi:hypothetical protein NDN08_001525 [Rhodosorus marinus]|uniref:S1 motif domain-containing protein n=1 Tax=Rhodosorus marinus TaxID=101924 RepID=A0AAV8UR79_9RHOD|nr:hypothetical protein NDN08_001525 [Rhodosorus marinus]
MESKLGFVVGLAGHRIGPLTAKSPSSLSWQSAQLSRHGARLFMCQDAPDTAKAPEAEEPEAVEEAVEAPEAVVEAVEAPEAVAEAVEAPEAVAEAVEAPEAVAEAVEAPESVAEAVEAPESVAEAVEAPEAVAEAVEVEETVVDEIAAEEEQSSDSSPTKARGRGRGRARKEVKYQISDLQVDMELDGVIRSTTKYGAFVDVGCSTDGLVHVSQLSSDYVENVEDVVKSGDNVRVRIIAVNADKNEFSLSMKPADEAGKSGSSRKPGSDDRISWNAFKFDPKTFVAGKVVSVTDYGAFVDVNGPTDGMVHISELSESRVESVDSILSVGDEIEVRITDADQGRRRISLSMVEWKPPGEAEAKVTASRKQLDEANDAVTSSNPFKSAFEIALEKASTK